MAGDGPDDLDLGRERDPAAVPAVRDHRPGPVCLLDLDRAAAVRHQLDLGLLGVCASALQPANISDGSVYS